MNLLSAALRAEIVAIIREEMTRSADVYTSRALPPDCPSRRRFHELAREIPEATKRGRVWVVPVAAWEAHRRPRREVQEDDADRLIAAAGFRSTRRGS